MQDFILDLEKCKPDGQQLCKNRGLCVIDDQGEAKCNCPTYFDGLHCEICKFFLNVFNPYEIDHYIRLKVVLIIK